MVRQCHSNVCPVGICTQDKTLRQKFAGTPEKVVNLFTFIAEDVRRFLSELGVYFLDAIIGRTDLLDQVSRGAEHLDDLDLNPLLALPDAGSFQTRCSLQEDERNEVSETLDERMIKDARPLLEDGGKCSLPMMFAIPSVSLALNCSI